MVVYNLRGFIGYKRSGILLLISNQIDSYLLHNNQNKKA